MSLILPPKAPEPAEGLKPGPKPRDPLERFWSWVDKDGPLSPQDGTRCWVWTGALLKPTRTSCGGYGMFTPVSPSPRIYVHRFAWEHLKGSIPAGKVIDHRPSCPKSCVNPDHLRLATKKQNSENRAGPQVNSSSGIRGVYWHELSNRWMVKVKHSGKQYYGGIFWDIKDAEAAAIRLRNELFTHNDLDRGTA